ncbi:hypothetical protein GCM10023187_57430 [Nibrella viscosa]|uniref:Uncharacterized protein n=1 Tax=Nibrella viscosa TaxID=1084524 RepID=A0ABP8L392_9BACT
MPRFLYRLLVAGYAHQNEPTRTRNGLLVWLDTQTGEGRDFPVTE